MSQAAAKYRHVHQPGAYIGPWLNSTTPYMVEPMDELTSRVVSAVIFVGPAQTGKTDSLIANWLLHSVILDPMDMIMYNPSQSAARDFSVRRIDRLHRHSKEVGSRMIKKREADNTYDKHYTSGMMLTLSWPSVTEFAGRPIGRVALTDYDRMPDDIDGEGSPFDLASKRTTTFQSYAMTMAESSPSRELAEEGSKWISTSPHEAPPTTGILALYNRGDRRRWYWPCPSCKEHFEGEFSMLKWAEHANHLDAADTVYMECPHCQHHIIPDDRRAMQAGGVWLKDGQVIDQGVIKGEAYRSNTASFWVKGVAAAFVSWKRLVQLYLDADKEYARTGSQEALKKFYNTDLGEVYMPQGMEETRLPDILKARAEGPNSLKPLHVPDGVRFLIALVDVQKNMFVVQVFGICPGDPYDMILIDRFNVFKSQRLDQDNERLWLKPGSYAEDWDELTEHVMDKTYPLADESGRHMAIKLTGCDSGGKAGVTAKAYEFYRKLREAGQEGRFQLIKGESAPGAPRARIGFPDSNRKDKLSIARGDVPVLFLNSNLVKDALNGRLDCIVPGKGMYRMPDWLENWFYQELCAERRTTKGWEKTTPRNEAWDLSYYALGLCASERLGVERFSWSSPPPWAEVWEKNSLITKAAEDKIFARKPTSEYDFGKLAAQLG